MNNTSKNKPTIIESKGFSETSNGSIEDENIENNSKKLLILAGTFLLLISAVVVTYFFYPYFEEIHLERMNNFWGNALRIGGIALLATHLGFLVYLLVLYFKYKVVDSVSDEQLPFISIIVPAYNEGELVWKTLISLAESNYPQEKIQLISIDDGSKE